MAQQLGNNYYNSPYKFNGKELDDETGLYYYGARYYDPRVSIWMSVDPLAEKYPNKTPYHFCSNNPINRTDPTGMLDDWYIDQNGAYLGQDGSTTNNIRMINRVDYNDVSEANGGTTSEAATQQLQSGSQIVTVDDAQIQGMMQDIHSATKSVENQMYIVLDKSNATIKGVLGGVGTDGEATIDSFTKTRKIDGVEQTVPGLFAIDADGKNWPLLSQVHTYNLIKGSSSGTGSSTTFGGSTTVNGFGTSAQDVATAKSLGIPIYAIDSWNYGARGQATIGRALPNGTQTSGVGTTVGGRGQTNANSVNVGTEALNYRVTGKTTR